MRWLGLALVALLVSACGAGGTASRADETSAAAPSGATACDEVVQGIAAFNLGDFDETVRHFEAAVPLAEAAADEDDSPAASDLLDAVRYYAELPAEDYLEAAESSPDFAKYKAITLGQCASADGEDTDPPGQLA